MTGVEISRRKPVRSIVLAALVSLVLGVLGPLAQADDAPIEPMAASDCPNGSVCWWTGYSYTGSMSSTTMTGPLAGTTAHSWRNRTAVAVRIYASTAGTGSYTCVAPGASVSSGTLVFGYLKTSGTTC